MCWGTEYLTVSKHLPIDYLLQREKSEPEPHDQPLNHQQ